jgi:UMF1 family MFS transporter
MNNDQKTYKRRIWAWTMYDWANSAFATTILAAVLPIYYSQVAGATLPSAAIATAYWGTGLSVSLLIAALLSPILGTVSDVMRGKKRFLGFFLTMGTVGTGLLIFVDRGDWLMASLLFVFAKLGFNGANVFYDALLPHIAKDEDMDVVSTRGYAMGYLGGGILLAINVVMIQFLPGTWGIRLSFLSVAVWWLVFSIPLFRIIPEPQAVAARLAPGENVISASFRQLSATIRDMRQYRELFKYLIAFLIYIDGIGTIIGVAAIYGAELGFGSLELILALLLVQFVGIPYSLIFGRLPSRSEKRRPFFLAFVLYNLIALPLVGMLGAKLLPSDLIGSPPEPYVSLPDAAGEGVYDADSEMVTLTGEWQTVAVSAEDLGTDTGADYLVSEQPGALLDFAYNGQQVEFLYNMGPEHGAWNVLIDGQNVLDEDAGEFLVIDAYNDSVRYDVSQVVSAETPGVHTLTLYNNTQVNSLSQDHLISIRSLEVLPPLRQSNLGMIVGMILVVEVVGLGLAALLGKLLFSGLVDKIDTRRGILLALVFYAVIAIWGFFLDSVIEFWFLAWMVAIVQGGSQALSRSLFASMSPASKSGEFFGLFGIMEKFSAILGPLVFAWAATTFNSSRPAVLSLILFFIVGGVLLMRVNVAEGRRVAQAEDAALLKERNLPDAG